MHFVSTFIQLLVISNVLIGCATTSLNTPSIPLAQARNAKEGLEQCKKYELQTRADIHGKSFIFNQDLAPYIQCFETTLLKFPQIREREIFIHFYRSFNGRYQSLTADSVLYSPEMYAELVKFMVAHYENEQLKPSENLSAFIKLVFPSILEFKNRKISYASVPKGAVEEELGQELAAEWSQAGSYQKISGIKKKSLKSEEKNYCTDYRQYLGQITELRSLIEYKNVIVERSFTQEETLKKKILDRILGLKESLLQTRSALVERYLALQIKREEFKQNLCLLVWKD